MVMLAGTNARIVSDDYEVGRGVVIEEGVIIKADRVRIGDYAYIGHGTRIYAPDVAIGDYTRINAETFAGGSQGLKIGHNCYVGGKVRLDSHGGLTIGNNVGIGDHSQIWTHIRHGSVVSGCRFNHAYPLHIHDDAWLVGHVLVGGAQHIGSRAMCLLGSTVTRDVPADTTYAGNPAKDITDKFGRQFETLTILDVLLRLHAAINDFEADNPQFRGWLVPTMTAGDIRDDGRTYFDVSTNRYTKRHSAAEVAFMRTGVYKPIPFE